MFLYEELAAHTASVRTSLQSLLNLQNQQHNRQQQQSSDDLASAQSSIGEYSTTRRKKTEIAEVESKLILCVNNWAFVEGLAKEAKFTPCQSKDVSVSLKLSSPLFKSETGEIGTDWSGYDFDRHGAAMPYSTFLGLLRSGDFTKAFLGDVKEKYENDCSHGVATADGSIAGPLSTSDDHDKDPLEPSL